MTKTLRFRAAVVVLALAAAVAGAAAERIRSVTVTGVTGDDLLAAQRVISARAGDAYAEKTLQDDLVALMALSFVQSAKAGESRTPEGVDVVYDLVAKGAVKSVDFTGNRKFSAKKLRKEANLEDFKSYDLARLNEAKDAVITKYKKAGYLFVKVDFSSQPDTSVLFRIDEGPRLKVSTVNIIGNAAFPDVVLKKLVKTKTRRYLILPYRLDEMVVEEDRLAIQDYYRSHGYLDAKAGLSLNLTKNKKGIIVDYMITEGELYNVRSISFSGNAKIASGELESALKMTSGKPFSIDYLGADVRALRLAYGRIGCIDCVVAPSTLFAETGAQVDVAYRINEGAPVDVSEVEIIGNDKTRDSVIRRELEFYPGERFDSAKLEESKKNLQRLSLFSKVEVAPDEAAPGTTPRGATVKVDETATGSFSIGAAVSTAGGIMGNITYDQRNFDWTRPAHSFKDIVDGRAWAGGGQFFQLSAQPGTKWSSFRMYFRNPRVNDSDYSFGLDLHLLERQRETFDERRTGADVTVGKRFSKFAFWETGLLVDTVKVSGLEDDAPRDVHRVRGTSQVNSARLTVGHDTRDNYVLPTDGHRVSATVEEASEWIGSDFNFTRSRLDGAWFKALRRDNLDRPYVLSWRGRLGYVTPGGGDALPIFERYFAGGANDVRGFEFRGLGPHAGDQPLGGKFIGVGGVEYEVPLAGDSLRAAVFYDTGTLLAQPGDLALNEIRHSVGLGIRFIVPAPINLPIIIDFGFPIKRKSGDDIQVFSFSLGRSM